jgi:hypothetical protein
MDGKEPLAEALRAEILKLATDGDQKGDGALTAEVLLRIMRVAKTGRDLLVSLSANSSNLANMIRRPATPFAFPMLGGNVDEEGLGDPMNPVYAPAPAAENFGMTALREMIAAAKNLNGGNSPSRLVEALAIAREKGLDDVARELEKQLGVGSEMKAAPSVTAQEVKP